MRRAALGKRHTDITRLKIGLARLGKKHTPEAIEKIRAERRARRPETLEELRARKERELKVELAARRAQWKRDVRKAYDLGLTELLQDVIRSKGLWSRRQLHHPEVSDGWKHSKGKWASVWGSPRSLEERVRIGLIKSYVGREKKLGLKKASGR